MKPTMSTHCVYLSPCQPFVTVHAAPRGMNARNKFSKLVASMSKDLAAAHGFVLPPSQMHMLVRVLIIDGAQVGAPHSACRVSAGCNARGCCHAGGELLPSRGNRLTDSAAGSTLSNCRVHPASTGRRSGGWAIHELMVSRSTVPPIPRAASRP